MKSLHRNLARQWNRQGCDDFVDAHPMASNINSHEKSVDTDTLYILLALVDVDLASNVVGEVHMHNALFVACDIMQ